MVTWAVGQSVGAPTEVLVHVVATDLDKLKAFATSPGLKRDMKEMEMRITIRLGALMMAAVGTVAALVKLL